MKLYKILEQGKIIESNQAGIYAGWAPGKIFGRLECKSGMRMLKKNRVFFHTLEDAVKEGYRPCQKCRPINEADFQRVQHLTHYKKLEEFYRRAD